ncbi:MAG: hypothetical protein NC548_10815 [Lachnospiraceae bacterium]|nr:hypothetical protein [Lachnospiraceae bacterium]
MSYSSVREAFRSLLISLYQAKQTKSDLLSQLKVLADAVGSESVSDEALCDSIDFCISNDFYPVTVRDSESIDLAKRALNDSSNADEICAIFTSAHSDLYVSRSLAKYVSIKSNELSGPEMSQLELRYNNFGGSQLYKTITINHSNTMLNVVASYFERTEILPTADDLKWFSCGIWRGQFLNEVFRVYSKLTYPVLSNLHPGMSKYAILLLSRTEEKSEVWQLGDCLTPVCDYIIAHLDLDEGDITPTHYPNFMYKVHCSRASNIEDCLRGIARTEGLSIPVDVEAYSEKYYVPYSKLLSYQQSGADIYQDKPILEIWKSVVLR